MEDQLQFNISTSKLKMRRAIIDDDKQEHGQKNRSNSGVAESNTNSLPDTEAKAEERVLKVHKKNFVFKNRPLGFRIEVAGKGDLPKSNIYRYVCIPTTNTELLSKGIPAGSGILNINGVDISKPDTPLKFVVTELQKLKNQPVKITFGVVKKTIIEDPLHYQEEAYWKTNDCLDVFNCGLNTYHEAS
mmetsp:Transcript_30773/g.49433  ORF Transcript_30773/g.49433 Transcript_30773/m.49433 type:complete len:188 (-) Transcript_30773:1658-2221(-)